MILRDALENCKKKNTNLKKRLHVIIKIFATRLPTPLTIGNMI